ncbi:unnamed protein product [Cuscuta campestris]|uniref:Uncharacterized protein n=1 Tax=Cuscuta campestris TaxID=132261 RepID=A0A484L202_9ASTE|nr:unnamed protein product [Cuscuta campestris]
MKYTYISPDSTELLLQLGGRPAAHAAADDGGNKGFGKAILAGSGWLLIVLLVLICYCINRRNKVGDDSGLATPPAEKP